MLYWVGQLFGPVILCIYCALVIGAEMLVKRPY